MAAPLQFSLARFLGFVTLVAVTIGTGLALLHQQPDEGWAVQTWGMAVILLAVMTGSGAGAVGILFDRGLEFAIVAATATLVPAALYWYGLILWSL